MINFIGSQYTEIKRSSYTLDLCFHFLFEQLYCLPNCEKNPIEFVAKNSNGSDMFNALDVILFQNLIPFSNFKSKCFKLFIPFGMPDKMSDTVYT